MYTFNGVVNKLNINNLVSNKKARVEDFKDEFILVNPNEIKEFCLDKSNLIHLINISSYLIYNFFPNSKIYLEYKDDPEYDDFDAIFAHIINKD